MEQESETEAGLNQRLIFFLREAAGIDVANCSTCAFCRYESDGDFGEYRWNECAKFERFQYLKSFPFKKTKDCWEPNFWASKFATEIDPEEGNQYPEALKSFDAAML